jgi:hypothetical protein
MDAFLLVEREREGGREEQKKRKCTQLWGSPELESILKQHQKLRTEELWVR